MIPDKIYLPKYPNYDIEGEHLGDDWSYEPDFTDNVTYIRKDALLEWLEFRKKDIAFKIIPGAEDPVMYGKLSMCKEIIDKLNEM